ncbi:hypothetical protein I302_105739 [Kwoniella bestiolae CBS 10118]|uniref:Chromo domain-containing protein n=1 Tax=Kwoniella bestiolae CBS 10118 TaxID=1296100 RepID=A0AAJ8KAF6_9TREE
MTRGKKVKREPSDSPPAETQFISQEDDSENLWEASEILDERGQRRTGEYLVSWKGTDENGKPWAPSWTRKQDCTTELINDWKEKRAKQQKGRPRSSTVESVKEEKRNKKRKLDDYTESRKKAAPNVTFDLNSRSSRSRSRRMNSSPVTSPEKTPAKPMTRVDSTSSALTPLSTTPNKSTDSISHRKSRQASLASEEEGLPAPRNLRNRAVPQVIDIDDSSASDEGTPGPGPSTAAHRSRRSTSSRKRKIPRHVPSPSPPPVLSFKKPGAHTHQSQTSSSSNRQSQADPIQQFSSPGPSSQKASTNPVVEVGADATDTEEPRTALSSRRTIERDGEEGVRLGGDSWEDSIPAGGKASPELSASIQDEDLDDLDSNSGADVEGEGEGAQAESDDPQVENGDDLHNDPPADPTPSPLQPPTHPDTLALEEAQSRISKAEADMEQAFARITALEAELEEARKIQTHPDTLALAEAQAKISELEYQIQQQPPIPSAPTPDPRIAELEAEISLLNRSKKSLTDDNQFLRQQYQEASNRAVVECQLSAKLQDQVKTLKTQLSVGLEQRRLHNDNVAKTKEKENAKLRGELKILLDQARLTGDSVRQKAAAYSTMKKEHDELRDQLVSRGKDIDRLSAKVESLSERNEELVDQLDLMRALKMGVIAENENDIDEEENSDSSDGDYDEDEFRPKVGSTSRRSDGPSNRHDVFQASTPAGMRIIPPTTGYACTLTEGDKVCRVVCETIEQLTEHGVSHHREQIRDQ